MSQTARFRACSGSGFSASPGQSKTQSPACTEAPMPVHYVYLIIAVAAETIGTSALQASQQLSRLGPSLIVIFAYGFSFYMMGLTLKYMPVGIVYAIWSGLGIVLIAAIGFVVFGQRLDLPAVIGMLFIIVGIVIIHLFSKSSAH
jgi:small multidrug resistance pump